MKKLILFCVVVLYLSQCTKTIFKYIEKDDTLIINTLDAEFSFSIPFPPCSGSLRLNDTITSPEEDIILTTFAYVRRQNNCCVFDLFLTAALKNGNYLGAGLLQCSKYDTIAPTSGYVENEDVLIQDTSDQALFICFYNQMYGKIETQLLNQNLRSPFCKSDGTAISDTLNIWGSYRIFIKRQSDGSRIIS